MYKVYSQINVYMFYDLLVSTFETKKIMLDFSLGNQSIHLLHYYVVENNVLSTIHIPRHSDVKHPSIMDNKHLCSSSN
jgi:hypothetical protein